MLALVTFVTVHTLLPVLSVTIEPTLNCVVASTVSTAIAVLAIVPKLWLLALLTSTPVATNVTGKT
jgi:hypothetical protein